MKSRVLTALSILALVGMTGCSSAAEPDEETYLEFLRFQDPEVSNVSKLTALLIEHMSDDVLLDNGYSSCEGAREADETVREYAESVAPFIDAGDATLEWHFMVADAAAVFLCPDLK